MAESLSQSQESVRGAHSRSASRVKSIFSIPPPSPTLKKRDYAIGICLLLVVVFLWTSSNFITQASRDPCWTTCSVTRRLLAPGSIWCGVQQAILVCDIASAGVLTLIDDPALEWHISIQAPLRYILYHSFFEEYGHGVKDLQIQSLSGHEAGMYILICPWCTDKLTKFRVTDERQSLLDDSENLHVRHKYGISVIDTKTVRIRLLMLSARHL